MTIQVNDVDALKSYLEAAMGRAKHHPGNVDGVILALTGAIVWKKDADPIEPMGSAGEQISFLRSIHLGLRLSSTPLLIGARCRGEGKVRQC